MVNEDRWRANGGRQLEDRWKVCGLVWVTEFANVCLQSSFLTWTMDHVGLVSINVLYRNFERKASNFETVSAILVSD